MLWGKGQGLLQIIIERKEKNAEKCQEILMNMFLRELEKRPSHKIENQIQIPYPSASPLRGWEIQSWNTTSLDEVSWLQPLSPQPGYTDNLLRNVSRATPLVVSEHNKRVCNQIRHKHNFFLLLTWMYCLKQVVTLDITELPKKNIVRCFLLLNSN